jgi:hypothetical protein
VDLDPVGRQGDKGLGPTGVACKGAVNRRRSS